MFFLWFIMQLTKESRPWVFAYSGPQNYKAWTMFRPFLLGKFKGVSPSICTYLELGGDIVPLQQKSGKSAGK